VPVIPIAILTGKDGKRTPNRYELKFEGLELLYKFNALYITDYKDDILAASDNPFALVILAAKKGSWEGKDCDQKLLKHKLLVLKLLYGKGIYEKAKIEAILTFLSNYVLFEKEETNRIFMKEVDLKSGKSNTMGIIEQLAEIRAKESLEKGLEIGRNEEREKSVKAWLDNTNFSIEKIASILDVPIAFVEDVKAGLFVNSK
jgi:hypothetical protein